MFHVAGCWNLQISICEVLRLQFIHAATKLDPDRKFVTLGTLYMLKQEETSILFAL